MHWCTFTFHFTAKQIFFDIRKCRHFSWQVTLCILRFRYQYQNKKVLHDYKVIGKNLHRCYFLSICEVLHIIFNIFGSPLIMHRTVSLIILARLSYLFLFPSYWFLYLFVRIHVSKHIGMPTIMRFSLSQTSLLEFLPPIFSARFLYMRGAILISLSRWCNI